MDFSDKALICMENAKAVGWDLNLSTIKALLLELDNPQDKCKSVHVTGTNGKGSVCAFLTQILVEAGLRVGRYNSPAVESELERYTINNQWISQEDYVKIYDVLAEAAEIVVAKGYRHPSVFELETALAFLYFAYSKCDIIIIEVGMGGLLDATNVMSHPLIDVFASIGMDHMQWLGNSLAEIAKNKAGIIKSGSVVVSAHQPKEALDVLEDTARSYGNDFILVNSLNEGIELGLNGPFQKENAACALECALQLRLYGFNISDENIKNGLKNTRWPFRFEKINEDPLIILDGAHNLPAIIQLKRALNESYNGKKLTFLISVLKDKSYDLMFSEILPMAENVILVKSETERGLDKKNLEETANKYSKHKSMVAQNYNDACLKAIMLESDGVICFGTFTFLNEIKKGFKEILS